MKYLRCTILLQFILLNLPVLQAQQDSSVLADTLSQPAKSNIAKPALVDSIEYKRIDSLYKDSVRLDSIQKAVVLPKKPTIDTSTYAKYLFHPYLPLNTLPKWMLIDYKKENTKDYLFYLLLGIVALLAFIKVSFSKYFKNLFLLFFQTSLRQKQTREQLLQDTLASLLINCLFLLSAGLFITLLMLYKGWSQMYFWNLYAYSTLVLLLIYLGKYLFISFSGWVFNNQEAAQGYIFLVSMVNRIMGVLLLPFTVFLAFAETNLSTIVITASIGLVILLLLYRYLVSFGSLRNDLKINAFHFFLYLCTIEILPLLLIYKLLVNYIG